MGADEVQDRMHEVISESLRQSTGEMLGRWVLVAETFDPDGSRATWLQCSPGQKPWESLGLLEFGKAVESALPRDPEDDA